MAKVSLLGDSIMFQNYGPVVERTLGDQFTVFRPGENGRYSAYTLWSLHDWWEGLAGSDIIHWNNGLWDETDLYGDGPFTPLDTYVDTMVRIARILKRITPNLIFATTTPPSPKMWDHDQNRIRLYNQAVCEALVQEGVRINDLFSLVLPNVEEYICEDLLHLSEAGVQACAKQVQDAITALAKEKNLI